MSARGRLLFISNLFPDTREPYRGLDNATLLHQLSDRWDIRVLAVRPTLPFGRRGWEARPADRRFEPRYVAAPYVPKFGSRWNHRLMAGALREPLREMRAGFPFEVVLSSWIFPDSCAVAELADELGFPFVAIAQGSDVHQYLCVPARRKIITRALPAATAIITRSAELARLLAGAGLPPDKLHPIHNGIDLACFTPGDKATARRQLDLPAEAPIILFVGNFYPIKNPLLLIEAHAHVCDDATLARTKLVMVGGGPLMDHARARADELRFGKSVIFTGRKTPTEVARYMQAADVLCLPSDNEGVPNVILEAFACGLPVVASRVGGIPEVHSGDDCGRLVEPRQLAALAAALRNVLRTPPARDAIAERGREFTWERAGAAYHALLASAVR